MALMFREITQLAPAAKPRALVTDLVGSARAGKPTSSKSIQL